MTTAETRPTPDITLAAVQALLARHIPLYARRPPVYQTELLRSLAAMWDRAPVRVLDIGGGTGIIAQALKDLLGVAQVTSVDVADRFLASLDIETAVYDGATLPFADASFDAVVLCNVIHHVPRAGRVRLLRECARVAGNGPVYIKDHVARSPLDHARLVLLDLMGNLPFGGMVRARYLAPEGWPELAAAAGYRIDRQIAGSYRAGVFARLFPNDLELTLRLVPGKAVAPELSQADAAGAGGGGSRQQVPG